MGWTSTATTKDSVNEMPTYDYRCTDCDRTVTLTLILDDLRKDQSCEHCGAILRRIFTPAGIVFKGTGWGKDGK